MIPPIILNIVFLIVFPFNIMLLRIHKKVLLIISTIIIGNVILINFIFYICKIQFKPIISYLIFGAIILFELYSILNVVKIKNHSILFVFLIISIILLSSISIVHKNINDVDCIGMYSSVTGISETKIKFYKDISPLFMSFDYYCIENYGIILTDKNFFYNTPPLSVEFNPKRTDSNQGSTGDGKSTGDGTMDRRTGDG